VKSLVAMTTLFVLVVLCGCGEKGGLSGGTPSSAVSGIPVTLGADISGRTPPPSTLDKEAAKEVLDFWKLTKVGQSYYVYQREENTLETTVFELRNVHVHLQPYGISEADKLNGVEWKGLVSLKCDAVRIYRSKRSQFRPAELPDTTWGQWGDQNTYTGCLSDMAKINGKWSDPTTNSTGKITFKQVEASDLPK